MLKAAAERGGNGNGGTGVVVGVPVGVGVGVGGGRSAHWPQASFAPNPASLGRTATSAVGRGVGGAAEVGVGRSAVGAGPSGVQTDSKSVARTRR